MEIQPFGQKEGTDFKITTNDTPSNVLVMAIHGGGIEFGTSDLTRQTAAPGGGESPLKNPDAAEVCLGGLDETLKKAVTSK
jgi:phage replication-related protein YjqB (UPF0714/DUF867 family)